jgi:hypothetical protein
VDEVLKFLSELQPNNDDEEKLKRFFFDKFYTGEKAEDPMSVDMKLDLLLHRQAVSNKLLTALCAQAKEEKPKWGTFVLFGKRVDLSSIVAFLGLF